MNTPAQPPLNNIEDFRAVFASYDQDGNGAIDIDELRNVMADLGEHPTASELEAMMQAIDRNGNGQIEFDEFLSLMQMDLKTDATEE
ncbi:MAG: EF-hand domain-containing protein [Spirulina sp. SIO3F2]|nr:EF-hand domain-containing protein [Spirulina sp. SIO3F2]